MENWKRLGLPIILGFAAAVTNWYTVSMKINPQTFVAVTRPVEMGETLEMKMLTRIEVSGDADLIRTAVPASQVATLLGQRVARRLQKGDIILRRDFVQGRNPLDLRDGQRAVPIDMRDVYVPKHVYVGDYISFPIRSNSDDDGDSRLGFRDAEMELGPFRVLAIGDQLIRDTEQVSKREVSKLTLLVHIDQPDEKQAEMLSQAMEERRMLPIKIWNENDGKKRSLEIREGSDNDAFAY